MVIKLVKGTTQHSKHTYMTLDKCEDGNYLYLNTDKSPIMFVISLLVTHAHKTAGVYLIKTTPNIYPHLNNSVFKMYTSRNQV